MEYREVSEVRDGMRIDWDVPIAMDDGIVLRADVYRPVKDGKYPVIMSYGCYGKWLHFEDGYETCWKLICQNHPDVPTGSTNKYQAWEVCDPEKWVPDGYAIVRVDSRGSGRSPGYIEHFSPRETKDFANCIEWAGVQPWSTGKVGLSGISYYAVNQWQVAALTPKHLAACCIWEGFNDFYREMSHNGGILNTFAANWYDMQSKTVQHGLGARGAKSRMNGDLVSGPDTLTAEELANNRYDLEQTFVDHVMNDEYWQAMTPDLSKIKVPLLSAANWGGQPLHTRGNFEGFVNAGSKEKWLEVHGIEHWSHYYTDYGLKIQKRFFAHFLKGEKSGWEKQPKVYLNIRHPGEKFVERAENEWPLKRTKWTKFFLDPATTSLSPTMSEATGKTAFKALGEGVTFLTQPLEQEMELTGPMAAKLNISSTTEDADLFLIVRIFDPNMKEITFKGALDPHTPIAQGWLRASHRKLDKKKSLPYRPWHTHDEKQLLKPGEVYELDVEIVPSCIAVPAGYRIGLTVRGRDYVFTGDLGGRLSNMKNVMTGVGPFLHDDPRDRPIKVFGGTTTIHFAPGKENFVLLPVIPAK